MPSGGIFYKSSGAHPKWMSVALTSRHCHLVMSQSCLEGFQVIKLLFGGVIDLSVSCRNPFAFNQLHFGDRQTTHSATQEGTYAFDFVVFPKRLLRLFSSSPGIGPMSPGGLISRSSKL